MTPEQISDRLEIHDVLVRYCHIVDQQRWADLPEIFTDDASVDYSAFGGPKSAANELSQYFAQALAGVRTTQHTISTSMIDLSGRQATARTAAQVMMVTDNGEASDHVFFVGLWYQDALSKVADKWKLRERTQEYAWVHNPPPGLGAPK